MYHKGQRVMHVDGITTGVVDQASDQFIRVRLDGKRTRWIDGNPAYWRLLTGAAESWRAARDATSAQQTGAIAYAYAYGYLDQSVRAALSDLMKLCRSIELDDTRSSALTLHRIEMTLSHRQEEAMRQLNAKLSESDASEIASEFTARVTLES